MGGRCFGRFGFRLGMAPAFAFRFTPHCGRREPTFSAEGLGQAHRLRAERVVPLRLARSGDTLSALPHRQRLFSAPKALLVACP